MEVGEEIINSVTISTMNGQPQDQVNGGLFDLSQEEAYAKSAGMMGLNGNAPLFLDINAARPPTGLMPRSPIQDFLDSADAQTGAACMMGMAGAAPRSHIQDFLDSAGAQVDLFPAHAPPALSLDVLSLMTPTQTLLSPHQSPLFGTSTLLSPFVNVLNSPQVCLFMLFNT